MKFALNYSSAAGRLCAAGVIAPDLFKCADFPEMIAAARVHRPVYVHFPLEAGPGGVGDLEAVARLREETGTAFVNVHLAARAGEIAGDVVDAMVRDVERVVARFGAEAVVVENLIYVTGKEWLAAGVEPAVIRAVVERTGCGLLLDTSHARIACHYLGRDARGYIGELPVARLRELHVTGLGMHEGVLTDHLPMTDDDWGFFEWSLGEIAAGRWGRPAVVACEYGGTGAPFAWRTDERVIAEQIPRMSAMMARL